MKIIVLGDELTQSHHFEFERKWLYVAAGALAVLFLSLCIFVALSISRANKIAAYQFELEQVTEQLLFDRYELDSFNTYAHSVFAEHAKQAASLQARISRLEALGGQVADMAGLNSEFDFYTEPAVGGPGSLEVVVDGAGEDAAPGEASEYKLVLTDGTQKSVLNALGAMRAKIAVREHELRAIEGLLANKQLHKERYLAGRPVDSGWLSSYFGYRTDPFTGKQAWHKGVDFAGKEGTKVLAVGSGVVTWAGDRYGYGQMVEINHGNGFTTRYGHNKENTVKLGQVVTKGQEIARMGSTGRSTGPHVHFEVLKNGKAVNPERYVYRKSL
jgi:septal ring factor EnvC (AmiA/AmiB activator)